MKIAILAAGGKNWNRHDIEIKGEKILERIFRQLTERGIPPEDIFFSIRPEDERPVPYQIIRNSLNGNNLGCIYGIMGLGFDLYIFGDVYFTDAGIDAVLMGDTEFYGRTKTSGVKNYGEMFAIKPTIRLTDTLEKMWKKYQAGEIRRLWSWDLYSEIQGKDFYKHRNTGNFTEIHDETEDFDKPEELEAWKLKYDL